MSESYSVDGIYVLRNIRTRADITVETIANRDAIKTYRRKWWVTVGVYNDPTPVNNGLYVLEYNKSSTSLGDNDNWEILDIHNRLHNIDSSDDHALQAEHANKIVGFDGDGKVAAQPTSQLKTKELKTKELKLPHVISNTAPNVGDHKEGDYWFKPVGQVFILAQSGTTKAWIEITPQKVE